MNVVPSFAPNPSSAKGAVVDGLRPPGRREPSVHAALDLISGGLLFFAVLFTPWAFGTTWDWAIEFMNGIGYLLGLLLLAKCLVRSLKGWSPARWDDPTGPQTARGGRSLVGLLAALTFILLAYALTHVLNARATFDPETGGFDYVECILWLPHSYDRNASWPAFRNCLALALCFWSARDWLLIKTRLERHFVLAPGYVPERLRLLLWLLCLNGGLLALEGLVQRATTDHLLWLLQPEINSDREAQFGPYAYRSNAAQFLNLTWPVAVGLWWALDAAARRLPRRPRQHHWLLGCAGLMFLAVVATLSRGALIAAVFCLICLALALITSTRSTHWQLKLGLGLLLALAPLLLGGPWTDRFAAASTDLEVQRVSMWKNAWDLVPENLWFGTGPGTFATVYQFAPAVNLNYWFAQLHNDWLETLLTWGVVGSALLLSALGLVAARWRCRPGLPVHRVLFLCCLIALAGCLLHAIADFPLQIYSVLFLFLLLCSVLSVISRPLDSRVASTANQPRQ